MRAPIRSRPAILAAVVLAGLGAGRLAAAPRFEVSFPASARSESADGRVFVIFAKEKDPEPRLQFGKDGEQYRSTPFFGEDVEAMPPGRSVVVGGGALGYPVERLAALPAGDYYVQAMLNVYTTFHRADGHIVKLHNDGWEGQVFQVSPGNLTSEVRRIHFDPAGSETVRLTLDRSIPPIEMPRDTESVKHIRFQSAIASQFWGQPIFVGVTVLLPRDYEKDKSVFYPVNYEQGHFGLEAPGGFGEKPGLPAGASERLKARARQREEFMKAWLSDRFPRMLYVTFQHPTPYYDDSYAVDSPNNGPYGRVVMEELIPYVETHFRAIRQPWARILSGGSTGGWESLALQIFHPDDFGGTFSACPDPVDFHAFQIVNIYDWDNAWHRDTGFLRVPLPGERDTEGVVRSTMEQQLKYERALGPGGRSGEDWDCWQAVFGPIGKDGYFQPLFDPKTGAIDKSVAAYWRDHSDLTAYLQRRWSEIGGKLAGKIHVTAGEMDTYYLNNAVHRMEDFLKTTSNPAWGGTILYGSREPHCWAGPLSQTERFRKMAEFAAANAPKDADRAWWRN